MELFVQIFLGFLFYCLGILAWVILAIGVEDMKDRKHEYKEMFTNKVNSIGREPIYDKRK